MRTPLGHFAAFATLLCVIGSLLLSCHKPIELLWKEDMAAASVSTPLVGDNFMAVGTDRGLSIFALNGDLRCSFDARGEIISYPATDGQRLYFGSTNYLVYALDLSCNEVWKYATQDRIKSDPAVVGDKVFIGSYDGHVYALSTVTGNLVWAFPKLPIKTTELSVSPLPTVETVTPSKGKRKEADPSKVKGEAKSKAPPHDIIPAKSPVDSPTLVVGSFSYSSPQVVDGVVYLGNLDGHIYALSEKDGALLWRFKTEGAVTSSPRIENGTLYIGSNDGGIYALRLPDQNQTTPTLLWRYATQGFVNSSARWVDGTIYIGSYDRHIYAIDASTGNLVWKFPTKGPVISIPAVYQNLVIVAGGSGDGAIYVLDRTHGKLFWKYDTKGKIESDPVIVDNRFYISSTDQNLYAFIIHQTKEDP